jgi:DNA-directed RNA polymerase subunit RPC12/RpoP
MSGKFNETTRRLAASIVKFLQDSQKNGTLDSEDAESMEVAVGIINESFGLDTQPITDTANILQVFEVYEKTREKMVPCPNCRHRLMTRNKIRQRSPVKRISLRPND